MTDDFAAGLEKPKNGQEPLPKAKVPAETDQRPEPPAANETVEPPLAPADPADGTAVTEPED